MLCLELSKPSYGLKKKKKKKKNQTKDLRAIGSNEANCVASKFVVSRPDKKSISFNLRFPNPIFSSPKKKKKKKKKKKSKKKKKQIQIKII